MNINIAYKEELKTDPSLYEKEFDEVIKKVKNSTAIYNGVPIDTLFMPKFFSEYQIEKFRILTIQMIEIIEKVIVEYINNAMYRKLFPFTQQIEELILIEHGFTSTVPISRIDFFYNENNEEFKFCEFNTDGASAMNEDRELTEIFAETTILEKLSNSYSIKPFELIDSWIDELLAIYKTSKDPKEKPVIAIIDFLDKATLEEFIVFKEFIEKRGITAIIADIREVDFDGKKLSHNGQAIDLVYRRAVTTEINTNYAQVSSFINACKSGEVCIVGPIKTQVVHNKMIFKILHMNETFEFLDEKEINFIKKHIPLTKILCDNEVDVEEVIKEKDKWIIKPIDLYGSKGVYAGLDFQTLDWEKKIKECIGKDYLIQEYYSPYMSEFPVFKDGKMYLEEFKNITGVYVYNGKMKGILSRAGQKAVISGINQGVTLPTFVYNTLEKNS
ncbi:hypothetical protein GC105_10510 [Alkalibaculum sp. M08DMB]|uniref:Glutathionylspermidine synthase pre-ATP-grasp-like domain-containing protein n=1 Tax=Alkalibaculum sporogenes TaxID=2655001 RepID=A0A6A7KA87_9FIRM|nr:glutathionylspermidine synthase family protein [Alkalibaculum sporogenes]MPW26221.1 hypothetical protein [Alkalibaculum sporogenes]